MKKNLERLRSGELSFGAFVALHAPYFRRMAAHFHRRIHNVPAVPIGLEDLEQIARVALWQSSRAYEYRCTACPRAAETPDAFARHGVARHGHAAPPVIGIVPYVHGEVGHALDHEVRRYERRRRFHVELDPATPAPVVEVEATQHAHAELSELLALAETELGHEASRVLVALALELPGLAKRKRDEVRSGFLRRWAC